METQMTESDGQLTPEQAKNRAAGFYRLAFLLTGDRARSLDVTLEAIDSGDGTKSFFSGWILAWSQRLVIAKALAGIRQELAASARRTASLRIETFALPSRNLVVDPDAGLDIHRQPIASTDKGVYYMFEKTMHNFDQLTAGQKAALKLGGISKLGGIWCDLMHNAPMWPTHGQYECRTCGRRHPVRWA
jgi:hypothetical protein